MVVTTDNCTSSANSADAIDASLETAVDEPVQVSVEQTLTLGQEFKIFISTFLTILAAEVGDKTQLTTLLMSAESQAPWIVFLGAGSALVATSLIGVLLGRWLSKRVAPRMLETSVGCLLLLITGLLLWDVIKM